MLTLTENASTAVKTIAERALGQDAEGGLRISAGTDEGYAVAIAATPEASDVVVENHGAHVFLEESASEALADKVLDAQLDGDGSVSFALANRA